MNEATESIFPGECPVCGKRVNHHAYPVSDFDTGQQSFQVLSCDSCHLGHTEPKPTAEQLDAYYRPEYYGDSEQKFTGLIEQLTVAANRYRAKGLHATVSAAAKPDRPYRILDIGCGRANLLKAFSQFGYECHGFEREGFDHTMTASEHGIHFHYGNLQDLDIPDGYFDIIVIWHVLEHLAEPLETIDICSKLLGKNGILAVSVPNYTSIQSRIFQRHWFHLDIPRHLYHFGKYNLFKALESRQFNIHSSSSCSLEQSVFGFIQSLLNRMNIHNTPNHFYQTLKMSTGKPNPGVLFSGIMMTILALPFALLEYIYSCLTGQGAVITVISTKTD